MLRSREAVGGAGHDCGNGVPGRARVHAPRDRRREHGGIAESTVRADGDWRLGVSTLRAAGRCARLSPRRIRQHPKEVDLLRNYIFYEYQLCLCELRWEEKKVFG